MHAQETWSTSALPVFAEAQPLGEADREFVEEIRAVLVKHSNQERFGLSLLHQHFPVQDDEILLETHDKESRELRVETVKRSAIDFEVKETLWSLAQEKPVALQGCAEDKCK